jgi:hypothetical protein
LQEAAVETADFDDGTLLRSGDFPERVSPAEILEEDPLVGLKPLDVLVERPFGA